MEVPKIEFKKILYTTDLSESGRHAFDYAASLSNLYHAELTALHVVEEGPELDKRLIGYIKDELWEEIKKRDLQEAIDTLINRKRENAAIVSKCVEDICETVQEDLPRDTYVKYNIAVKLGHPVEEIIKFAEKGGYDLIVIGSHGHDTLKDAMLGNTVRRVLRKSKIPVMVVRLPE